MGLAVLVTKPGCLCINGCPSPRTARHQHFSGLPRQLCHQHPSERFFFLSHLCVPAISLSNYPSGSVPNSLSDKCHSYFAPSQQRSTALNNFQLISHSSSGFISSSVREMLNSNQSPLMGFYFKFRNIFLFGLINILHFFLSTGSIFRALNT